jgi:hypothetical protein
MKPELCNASPKGIGHAGEYGKIGFSPCGEYVSHESDKPCNPLPVNEGLINKDNCHCKEALCPCGEFLSHRVIDPCTAKISEPEIEPEVESYGEISLATNVFSEKEIDGLYEIINSRWPETNKELGRIEFSLPLDIIKTKTVEKLQNVVKQVTDVPLEIRSVTYVEYNSLYGNPNLPPHLDADVNDLILNIQIESNTDWALGLDLKAYKIEDNSALIFNPNKQIHWRAHKEFKDGEYVRMLFIRLFNPESPSDYSHLDVLQDDEMFKEAREFRDSYPQV